MILALKGLGVYSLAKSNKSINKPIEIIVEDPASNPNYKFILAIILNKANSSFEYKEIKLEEYTKEKIGKYLYRKGSPRGTDYTPTARLVGIEKTFTNKILLWFTNSINQPKLNNDEKTYLEAIFNCLKQNQEKIISDLQSKVDTYFKQKENAIITIKLLEEDEKYIGEIPIFRKLFERSYKEKLQYSPTFNVQSLSIEKSICSVCMQEKEEVYGFVNTFNFYTVDKQGFVVGGFDRRDAWKNYPVCFECALLLEEGKKYLESNLLFKSYGKKYFILPSFLETKIDQKEIFSIIEQYKKDLSSEIKIKKKYGDLLTDNELEILDILTQQKNYMNYNFMFFEEEKSAFRILLYIEDILPSRLLKLFEAKDYVDKCTVALANEIKLREIKPFTYENIWYFSKSISMDYSKYFFEVVNNIFTNKRISYAFIMDYMIKKIQDDFRKNQPTTISTMKAMQLLLYLNYLDLLSGFRTEESKMNEIKFDEILKKNDALSLEEKIVNFFDTFSDFFNSSAKKAIFLEGALTQFLLNIQYRERNSYPFRARLQGLKMTEQLIKRLLPEIQNKLEEYGANYYRELESIISKYILEAGNQWKISNNDISYYFTLGMNLSSYFKDKKGENKSD